MTMQIVAFHSFLDMPKNEVNNTFIYLSYEYV